MLQQSESNIHDLSSTSLSFSLINFLSHTIFSLSNLPYFGSPHDLFLHPFLPSFLPLLYLIFLFFFHQKHNLFFFFFSFVTNPRYFFLVLWKILPTGSFLFLHICPFFVDGSLLLLFLSLSITIEEFSWF